MPLYPSTVHGGGKGDGTQSRQEARLGLQPLTDYAGTSFTIGRPGLRKDAIDNIIRFDAERVLNNLGGLFAVVTVDGSFQQVTHLRTRTGHNRHQAPKIGPASRHDNLRFFVGDAYQSDFGAPHFKQDNHKLDHHPSAAFRFARRHGDLADRSGRLRQFRQQQLPQQNSDRNGSRRSERAAFPQCARRRMEPSKENTFTNLCVLGSSKNQTAASPRRSAP